MRAGGGSAADRRGAAAVLERAQPLAGRARAAGRRRGRVWPSRRARRSTCRRSPARPWTASPFAPRIRRAGCRSSTGSPPGGPAPRALEPGEAMAIATGGVVPTAPTPSSRSSMLSSMATRWRSDRCGAGRATFARAAATARGEVVVGPATGSARRSSARWQRPASPSPARGARAPPCWRPAPSSAPGESLAPGQIYEANGSCSRRSSRRGRGRRAALAVADDRRRTALRSSAGLEADVLVTSGGVSVGAHDLVRASAPSSASRRCSGASRSSRGSRCRSACAADARLRPARQSGLVARRASSCSFGRPCWRSRARRPGRVRGGPLAAAIRRNAARTSSAVRGRRSRTASVDARPCAARSRT